MFYVHTAMVWPCAYEEEAAMDLMKQCQVWNESDEYQKIIHAIEALPQQERSPELDSELARAYNNLADVGDRALFEKAIALLKPHEEYFQGDHSWNFRMAYAYYYLDQEGLALHYFEQALEARPGDEDTQQFIDDCRRRLALPRFDRPFRERVAESWTLFENNELELRRLLDQKFQDGTGEALVERCRQLLAPAFADVDFELGYHGKKYELILTPDGDRAKLFALVYYQRRAPQAVLEHWNILVGRQPSGGFHLCMSGIEQTVSAQDVQVWVEKAGEGPEHRTVSLTLYCEKLLPLLQEREGTAWWMLSTLTDQVLGEIPAMAYIEGFEVVNAPRQSSGISLEALPGVLQSMGMDLSLDAEQYLEQGYLAYHMEPKEDPDANWRLDTIAGSTRCPVLLNQYLQGKSDTMDAFHQDGAAPGFFCYPLDCFAKEEERGKAALDFRDALEAALLEKAGADAVTFLGGASGVYCGYLDFIAWDLAPLLDAAVDLFQDSPVAWANFHTFRQDVGTVTLKKEPSEQSDTETADGSGAEAEQEGEGDHTGSFAGFVLLSDAGWEKEQLVRDLKADWEIDAAEEDCGEQSPDTLVFSVDDMMGAVSLVPAPVPDREAEKNAANNYLWPQAVDAAKAHQAHLIVAVLGRESSLLERGKLFAKIVACCCKQRHATGVYASGTVFQPSFYQDFADLMKVGELPIFNWIWFGLYHSEGGVCCYTYGMKAFGKDEMEVLNADAKPSEVRDFLSKMAAYVLEYDATLQDGETIGFSEDQKLPITRSAGVSLPGMTLKIDYGPA